MKNSSAPTPVTADGVTSALVDCFERMASALGAGALTKLKSDAFLMITGVPVAALNTVLTVRASAAATDVAALLDEAATSGVPYSIQVRPGCDQSVIEVIEARALAADQPTPLMAFEPDLGELRQAAAHPDLSVRALAPHEAELHAAVAAEGFGAPVEWFRQLVPDGVLSLPGVRAYVGTAGGELVTTAFGVSGGDYVGIFNVATPGRHRGRGFGAAITAQVALDGLEAGARYAYLQSSSMGFAVYERLGFRTIENWATWAGGPSHSSSPATHGESTSGR